MTTDKNNNIMTTAKVIELYPQDSNIFFATCPECGGVDWNIVVDNVGLGWENILGTQCSDPDCECFIKWVRAYNESADT